MPERAGATPGRGVPSARQGGELAAGTAAARGPPPPPPASSSPSTSTIWRLSRTSLRNPQRNGQSPPENDRGKKRRQRPFRAESRRLPKPRTFARIVETTTTRPWPPVLLRKCPPLRRISIAGKAPVNSSQRAPEREESKVGERSRGRSKGP